MPHTWDGETGDEEPRSASEPWGLGPHSKTAPPVLQPASPATIFTAFPAEATMNRRTFLCGSLLTLGTLAAPLMAEAQREAKAWRIGLLGTGLTPFHNAFRDGLRELGYI